MKQKNLGTITKKAMKKRNLYFYQKEVNLPHHCHHQHQLQKDLPTK